jgi:hypothetical protein
MDQSIVLVLKILDVAYWINYGNCYAWSSGVIVAMEKLGFFFFKISKIKKKNQNLWNFGNFWKILLNFRIFIFFYFIILNFFFFNFEILWNFMKTEIFKIFWKFWNLMKFFISFAELFTGNLNNFRGIFNWTLLIG